MTDIQARNLAEAELRELEVSVLFTYSKASKLDFSQISLLLEIVLYRVEGSLSSVPKEVLEQITSQAKKLSQALDHQPEAEAEAEPTATTTTPLTQVERLPLTTSEPNDNWVQCDECDTWHRVETLEDLPEKWFCEDKGKSCRPPKEAHLLWPASLAKRVIKYIMATNGTPIKKISHYEALKMLAERKDMTLSELFNTKPWDYLPHKSRVYCRGSYPRVTLGWLPMPSMPFMH
jgi:hypothetical protein